MFCTKYTFTERTLQNDQYSCGPFGCQQRPIKISPWIPWHIPRRSDGFDIAIARCAAVATCLRTDLNPTLVCTPTLPQNFVQKHVHPKQHYKMKTMKPWSAKITPNHSCTWHCTNGPYLFKTEKIVSASSRFRWRQWHQRLHRLLILSWWEESAGINGGPPELCDNLRPHHFLTWLNKIKCKHINNISFSAQCSLVFRKHPQTWSSDMAQVAINATLAQDLFLRSLAGTPGCFCSQPGGSSNTLTCCRLVHDLPFCSLAMPGRWFRHLQWKVPLLPAFTKLSAKRMGKACGRCKIAASLPTPSPIWALYRSVVFLCIVSR